MQPITPDIIARLSINIWFGCLTRNALDLALEGADRAGKAIVYFDIDRLKQANSAYGKEEVSRRIREAFTQVRHDDIIIGNWFSGDEFVALVPLSDAIGFAKRMQASLHQQGLSATFLVWTHADMDAAERQLTTIKDAWGVRDAIFVM